MIHRTEQEKEGFTAGIPFGSGKTSLRRELGAKGQGYARAVKRPSIWPKHETRSQFQISTLAKITHIAKQAKFFFWNAKLFPADRELPSPPGHGWGSRSRPGQREKVNQVLRMHLFEPREQPAAAELEDGTEKSAVTPGPLAPARQLLGEMRLAADRPAQALEPFEATLKKEPRRFRALYGAGKAAQLPGRTQVSQYFGELVNLCEAGDRPGRPEFVEAQKAGSPNPEAVEGQP
jgi:hypothetical protein